MREVRPGILSDLSKARQLITRPKSPGLLGSKLQKPRLLKSYFEVWWVLCRLLGTKAERKHPERNESRRTSPAEALTGFGHHFKRMGFLRMPLRHCLFISLFWVALTRQEGNLSKRPGLPMVETAHSSHWLHSVGSAHMEQLFVKTMLTSWNC